MSSRFTPVLHEIDFVVAEAARVAASGPHFKIVHRFQVPGTHCRAGEEVSMIAVIHASTEYPLKLPLALRILLDYMARHRLPQSATQIEAGIKCDSFAARHGANARTSQKQTRRISRSAVKEYVRRIRLALGMAFQEAGLNLDPAKVLVSEETVGNEVIYRLKAAVDWTHIR